MKIKAVLVNKCHQSIVPWKAKNVLIEWHGERLTNMRMGPLVLVNNRYGITFNHMEMEL